MKTKKPYTQPKFEKRRAPLGCNPEPFQHRHRDYRLRNAPCAWSRPKEVV